MKKALITTIFTVPNYGSVLQAYATQFILERLGYDCEILNYDHNRGDWAIQHGVRPVNMIRRLIYRLGIKASHRKANLLKSFIKSYFHLTKSYLRLEIIRCREGDKYDLYVSGSDQIWNTRFTNCDPVFLLKFVSSGKKCISLASSFACKELDIRYKDVFKNELGKYASISVRESHGVDILNQLGFTKVGLLLDPTLLLSKEQWGELREGRGQYGNYILLYLLRYSFDPCPYIYDVLRYYQEKMKCNIIALEGYEANDMHTRDLHIIDATDSSIPNFMEYFANASLVVTSSFHGTAFALNFGVPLISVIPESGDDRQSSLLKQLDLTQCQLKLNEDIGSVNPFYDVKQEQEKLALLRNESLNWIKASV